MHLLQEDGKRQLPRPLIGEGGLLRTPTDVRANASVDPMTTEAGKPPGNLPAASYLLPEPVCEFLNTCSVQM